MRHALAIYRRLLGVQIRSQLQYRAAFLLEALAALIANGMFFLSLALVLQRFEGIGGWGLGEIAFLVGMVEMAFATMDIIFSGFDPSFFGRWVRLGTFDQLMLRPVNLTVQVLGSRFVLRRVGRLLQGIAIFAVALTMIDVQWTAAKLLFMPFVFLAMVAFFGGLFVVGATITFWTVESIEVMNIFTYGGSEMISYPMDIYPGWLRSFFTFVVPAIFLNYYPALYILGIQDPLGLPAWAAVMGPAVGLGMLGLALLFWRFGVRHYQSTGT
jgi:ABC-2 type transport system permease protein